MANNNNSAPKSGLQEDESKDQQQQDPAVQRGKAAIAARQAVSSEPEHINEKNEQDDAEQWRNEG